MTSLSDEPIHDLPPVKLGPWYRRQKGMPLLKQLPFLLLLTLGKHSFQCIKLGWL